MLASPEYIRLSLCDERGHLAIAFCQSAKLGGCSATGEQRLVRMSESRAKFTKRCQDMARGHLSKRLPCKPVCLDDEVKGLGGVA